MKNLGIKFKKMTKQKSELIRRWLIRLNLDLIRLDSELVRRIRSLFGWIRILFGQKWLLNTLLTQKRVLLNKIERIRRSELIRREFANSLSDAVFLFGEKVIQC